MVGFLAALAAVPAVNFPMTYLMNAAYPHLRSMALSAAAATSLWAVVIGSPVVALGVGIALVAFFRWKWLRLRQYVLLGALLGALPGIFVTIAEINWLRHGLPYAATIPRQVLFVPTLLGVVFGACSAAAFWFAAVRPELLEN